MKKFKVQLILVVVLIFGLLLSTACSSQTDPVPAENQQQEQAEAPQEAAPEEEEESAEAPPTDPPPTETPAPTPVPPTDTPEPTPTLEPLPPEPQELTFQSADGTVLNGRYYPAAVNPAPMIVLMHWAPGDMEDWNEIAFWLQNRGMAGTSPNHSTMPWLDESWFPPMIEGQSFAVFTFTFRDCDGGCNNFMENRALWLQDAAAAMKKASELEGVDSTRIAAIGASIGADGASDGCYLHNDAFENTCLGALSLSPGHYLTVMYNDAVAELEAESPPKPDWCFYAQEDPEATNACNSAEGSVYQKFEWSGQGWLHGMDLLQPDVDPSAMELILDFLTMVFNR